MKSETTVLPHKYVSSLAFTPDDSLVDWVGGGCRYLLDGEVIDRPRRYAYAFDAVTLSPSGDVAVIYTRHQTKGLLLHKGEVLRELDRSYYQAASFEYPICLFERAGRTLLAHCPRGYNRLDIEDALTGELLTARPDDAERADFFHSRLAASPNGKRLISAGWVWQPWDVVSTFEVDACLADPNLLDVQGGSLPSCPNMCAEEGSATWLDDDVLCVAAGDELDQETLDEYAADGDVPELLPNGLVSFDLNTREILSRTVLAKPAGVMHRVDRDHVFSFFEHPKVIRVSDGAILQSWPDLATGKQQSSISREDGVPILAVDPHASRFAVHHDDAIHVVTVTL